MNLQQIKGETESGDIIDEESMSKSEKALAGANIAIREYRNGIEELRDPMEILKELADKWETLSSIKQSKIVEGLGGKYRGAQLVALLEGWDIYEKTVGEFLDHNNSAIKENERYLDSWQAKSKQLSAAVTQMWQTTINTEYVKKFIDGMRAIVEQLTKMGGLVPIISGLLGYLLYASIAKSVIALGGMAKTIGVVIAALKAFNISLAFSMALTGKLIPILAGLAVGYGAYYAITRKSRIETDEFNKAITIQTRKAKELGEALDSTNQISSDYSNAENGKILLAGRLIDALYDLEKAYDGSEVAMTQMLKVKDKINSLIPKMNIEIDKETGKIKTQKTEVDKLIKSYGNLVMVKASEKAAVDVAQVAFEAEVNIKNEQAIIDRNKLLIQQNLKKDPVNTMNTLIQGEKFSLFDIGKDLTNEQISSKEVNKLQQEISNAEKVKAENESKKREADARLKSISDLYKQYSEDIEFFEPIKDDDDEVVIIPTGDPKDKITIPEHLKVERYQSLNEELNRTQQAIKIYQNQLNSLAEDDESRIDIKEKQIELMKQEQKQLHALANAQRDRRDELSKTLSTSGVQFSGTGDNMTITNRDTIESQLRNRVNSLAHLGSDNASYQAALKAYEDITEKMEEFVDINDKGIKDAQASWWDLQGSIFNTGEKIEDFYKKQKELLEKQAEEQKKLYDEKVDAVNETELKIQDIIKHGVSKRKKLLDDELDKLKDTTDKKIEQYEREWDSQDKEKRDAKQVAKVSDLQKKINALSRDTSLEGISERKELEKELSEELETMEENREDARRELIKRTLQDTVKNKEESVDKTKKAMDDEWNHEKVALKASEIMRKQSFSSLKTEFPELFEELKVSSDGFFSVFESYEEIVVGSTTTMKTKIQEIVDTARLATQAMNDLFTIQDKTEADREAAKIKIGQNQTKFKELEAKGYTMDNNPVMRHLHEEANKLREDNDMSWENLVGYKGDIKSNVSNVPTMDSLIKNIGANTLGRLMPSPISNVGGAMSLVMNVSGIGDSNIVSGVKQAGSSLLKQFTDALKKKGS